MKERKGPFGQMVGGIVDTVVQGARRRAQDREPRALVYDEAGQPRLLPHDAPGRDELIATAGQLIDLVGGMTAEAEAGADEETEITPEDVAAVAAVEPEPDELDDAEVVTEAEVVTDAEVVDSTDDVATAADEVATAETTVPDADVVAPDPADEPPGDERP